MGHEWTTQYYLKVPIEHPLEVLGTIVVPLTTPFEKQE